MELKDLIKFIEIESERIIKYYGSYLDQEKRILAMTVKLAEEFGELCERILAYNGLQRKEKSKKFSQEKA